MGHTAGALSMAYFVFPQKWIAAAISAGVMAFGSVDNADDIRIHYLNLPGNVIGATREPGDIGIDKRPKWYWKKWRAQCVIVHEYGHLAGRRHSSNPRNIMYLAATKRNCLPWLRRHGLR